MNCDETRARLGGLSEDLPPGRDLLEHLRGCPRCRDLAIDADPSLLFALAASDPPAPDWTGFNRRVRIGIEREKQRAGLLGRILETGILTPRRLTPALAAAAAVAVAAILLLRQEGPVGVPPAPVPRVAAEGPSNARGVTSGGTPGEGARILPSPVDAVASPTARVLQLQLGDQNEPSDVVLILDEGMEL